MGMLKKLAKELSASYNNVDIMKFKLDGDNIYVRFAHESDPHRYLCFKECQFKIVKVKTLFGRHRTQLQLVHMS